MDRDQVVGEKETPCLGERKEISRLKSEIALQPTISEQSDDPIKALEG